jgi:hypothetical protein
MKFRALKECPQGQQPGDVFEATEDAGAVLESVGAAERVVEPDPKEKKHYKRRDLTAEDR